jgi:hypothetical protein
MIAALDGISPGAPPGTGPQSTSSSAPAVAAPAPAGSSPGAGGSAAAAGPAPTAGTSPTTSASASGSGSGSQAASPSSGSPAPPATTTTVASITGVYNGTTVSLTPVASSSVLAVLGAGTLTDFQTNVAAYSCLNGSTLNVYDNVDGKPVAEAVAPTNCIAQDFELP